MPIVALPDCLPITTGARDKILWRNNYYLRRRKWRIGGQPADYAGSPLSTCSRDTPAGAALNRQFFRRRGRNASGLPNATYRHCKVRSVRRPLCHSRYATILLNILLDLFLPIHCDSVSGTGPVDVKPAGDAPAGVIQTRNVTLFPPRYVSTAGAACHFLLIGNFMLCFLRRC